MKKKAKGKVGLYILCGALTIFILMMFLSFNNITEIFGVIKTANVKYILIAIGLLLLFALLSPLPLCILTKAKKYDVSFKDTYVIGMIEHFFSGITPFSTGGQPFQAYSFNKVKVKPADSTGLLMMNFIIFMLVTNAFAACSLFYYERLTASISELSPVIIIGFSLNFLVFVFLISLSTSKTLRKGLEKIVLILCKIKFLKKFLEPKVPKLNEYFEQVQIAFKDLFRHKLAFIFSLLVRIVIMAIYYALTFFILRALHIEVGYDQLFFIMCGTSFAITMVVWLPTPGSSGGIEFAFKSIFLSIAGVSSVVAYGGMLIWRLLSYYLLMLISLGFYIYFEIYYAKVYKKKHANEIVVNSEEGAESELDLAAATTHENDELGEEYDDTRSL